MDPILRSVSVAFTAAVAIAAMGTATLESQTAAAPAKPLPKPAVWVAPKTSDGKPDLQGIWTSGTLTPFERPAAQANKPFLTEEEAAEVERQSAARRANPVRRPGDVGTDNEAFVDSGYKVTSTRQTSLVVDPPDGRVQILPAAEAKRDFNLRNLDSFETMSPWDRCITRGPTGLFPAAYNNAIQIVQTPTHVVLVTEMIHEARIVPVDGSPHASPRVRSWTGDSRGHWEGSTLVVDTTNFHARGWITTHASTGRLRGTPTSEQLHLVERFTRVDADTLIYSMTIDDPEVYARPWTVSFPFNRDDTYQIFEYACHEGNKATELILRGARVQEQDGLK